MVRCIFPITIVKDVKTVILLAMKYIFSAFILLEFGAESKAFLQATCTIPRFSALRIPLNQPKKNMQSWPAQQIIDNLLSSFPDIFFCLLLPSLPFFNLQILSHVFFLLFFYHSVEEPQVSAVLPTVQQVFSYLFPFGIFF